MNEFIVESVRRAANHPWRSSDWIGRRSTPYVSFWPMRDKWKKWGQAWTVLGTDGDYQVLPNGNFHVPAVLKLVYIVCADGRVCQLAYVLQREVEGMGGEVRHALPLYERARGDMPTKLIE